MFNYKMSYNYEQILINLCFQDNINRIDNLIELYTTEKDKYFIKKYDYNKLYFIFKNEYITRQIKNPNIYYNNFIYLSNRMLELYNNYLRYNSLYKCVYFK